jgi:thioesterase domain-containing protein/acyl carrier protein
MVPAMIVELEALPLTPNGKLDRAALPRPEAAPMRQRFTAPRDSTEMRLAALWEDLLDVRPIGVRDDFFDLGGHSLLAVRLMARVRDTFGADIALADVLRAPTIERLADRIRAGVTRQRSSLVPIQPSGSRRPFFCLPGAGGNTIYFYNLARQLGSDQPFYGLQGVGFDGEAPPHDSVEQMAAHAIGEVRARQPHGPYAIGGHSLGAWVAYEMVQRLVAEGEAVSLLALIDTPVPHPAAVRETSDWDQARWIVELADRIARLLDPSLSVSLEALRQLDEAAQVETFRAALHRTDLFPGEAGAAHLANALALFRAHSRVRYTARPAPESIAVTLLRTAAPPPHLAAVAGDPTWGWGTLARVDVHQLPGDHLAILRPPHVAALAAVLSAALERAEAAIGASCLQRSF